MKTCGNCKYWSGRFSAVYMGCCLYDITEITLEKSELDKLEEPKHLTAFDDLACRHWELDVIRERDIMSLYYNNFV